MKQKPEGTNWRYRLFQADATQKCVKCGQSLPPGSQGGDHGWLGSPMCTGKPLGRISYRLYVDDIGSGSRLRKATAEEKRQYKHLLDALRARKGRPHYEREYVAWTPEEMYEGMPSYRLPHHFFTALLRAADNPDLERAVVQAALKCTGDEALGFLAAVADETAHLDALAECRGEDITASRTGGRR
jgi:hypothetical protein